MSSSKLGKGLASLIDTTQEQDASQNTEIEVSLLKPNPWQPRSDFSEENLDELAASIRSQGIIQPLLVRQMPDGTYQVVAGERRLRAAKKVGLATVPVFVRAMSDAEVMAAALIENLQREDLNPIEEALALKNLRDSLNLTQEMLSTKLGRSRSSVANSLRLLQLSPAAQNDVRNGKLSAGHARTLLGINDIEVAEAVRKYIVQKDLSVREAEDLISQWKATGTLPWIDDSEFEESAEEDPIVEERPKKSAQQTEIAKKMQDVISRVLQCKAKVRGTEEKGKITISYSNAEELQQILMKIGAETLSNENADGSDQSEQAEPSPGVDSADADSEIIISSEDASEGNSEGASENNSEDNSDVTSEGASEHTSEHAADGDTNNTSHDEVNDASNNESNNESNGESNTASDTGSNGEMSEGAEGQSTNEQQETSSNEGDAGGQWEENR